MKTERRHELQTNVLADALARWIERIRPYSRAGLALMVGLVVLIFAWLYLENQNTRQTGEGWNEYFDAINTPDPRDRLSDISQQYAGTIVSEWARLSLAEIQLENGTNRLFVDKPVANKDLREAAEKFQSILIESRQPTLLERATYGLAQAHEAQGALAKARDEYREIVKSWPDSPYVANAEARAKDLDQPDTKSFYDWFAKYEPPRPLSSEPGTPGVRPDFLKDPLEGGGLKIPSVTDDSSAPPAGSTEPADGQQPESTQPADEKPADEKPADGAAPAESK
jgi:tetratricopeptide (TPR) repeat protein